VLSASRKRTIYLPSRRAQGWTGPSSARSDAAGDVGVHLDANDGLWWEFETAKRVSGGVEITRPVALNEVPVYVKAGSIIPRQDPDGEIHAGHIHELVLDVYPQRVLEPAVPAGSGILYEDDGRSPSYRDGTFCRTQFTLTNNCLTGEVVEGKPLGMKRQITVILATEVMPRGAILNGQHEIVPEPHGSNRSRFILPELPADMPFKLEIKW
jgi:hypothetical protein